MSRATSLFFFSILGASLALACSASTIDGTAPGSGAGALQPDASDDRADKPSSDDGGDDDPDDAGPPRARDGGRRADAGPRPGDAGPRFDGGSGDGGLRFDASTPRDAGTVVGAHCATLSACCSELPSAWQAACTNDVDLNNDSECQRLYGVYQGDGYCGGGQQGACTSLDACCQQVPSAYYSNCEYYVTANSQTDCATIHANYKSSGWCN